MSASSPVLRPLRPATLWLLGGAGTAALFTVATVAWRAANEQRKDGEAALRETARLTAQRALDSLPQEAGFMWHSGSNAFAGSLPLEVHYPIPSYQFGISFSPSWFQTPGAPDDWIFGPWPQPESELSLALGEVQSLLAANQGEEAKAKFEDGPLAVFPATKTPNGTVLLMLDNGPPASTAAGLPLPPLATRLRMQLAESEAERRRFALQLLVEALAFPSPITDLLILEATQALPSPNAEESSQIEDARRHAAELTAFRQVARLHRAEIQNGSRWLERKWHLNSRDGRVSATSRDQIMQSAQRAGLLGESVPGLPDGWKFRPWLNGESLTTGPPEAEAVLASATNADWNLEVVSAAQANPFATLDAQLLRQRWLIAGAAGALGLAVAGVFLVLARQRRNNSMMENFVAAVSHELRAPIGSMGLLAERLGDSGAGACDQGDQTLYPNLIRDECRRLSATIENVFAFSRIKRGRAVFDPELADLSALLRDTADAVKLRASRKNVILHADLPETAVECEIDPVAVRQAVLNLLDNAVKFSPDGSKVTLALKNTPDTCEIVVQDQGPGIPSPERQRIFEPFYRTGSERRRETPGIGIGLAIVKEVVASHGGTVEVGEAPDGGAEFRLILPSKSKNLG